MSSKQKIAISAVGIVLVLAIIGLTVGLVLVASTVTTANTMKVSYTATNVKFEISGVAQAYKGDNTKVGNEIKSTPDTASVDATQTAEAAATSGSLAWGQEIVIEDNGNGYVVYTFTIKNTATEGAKAIIATGAMTETGTNIDWDVNNSGATSIAAGSTGTIVVTATVHDASINATATGSLNITVTQVG